MNGPQHACGNCGQTNSAEAQYCAGCGLFLWEKCHGCNALVLLGQPFCNKCGTNLNEEFEKRLAEAQARLERVEKLAMEGHFTDAIKILKPNLEPPDFRFKEVSARAQALYEDFVSAREKWAEQVPVLETQAKSAMENADYPLVCELLETIPQGSRSEECQTLLDQALQKQDLAKESKASLKTSLAEKDWQVAMADLVTLVELYPAKQKYRDLLISVSEKIASRTKKLIGEGLQAEALAELNSIPIEYQSEQHAEIRRSLDDLLLARKLVASAPFATPLVTELVRFLRKNADDKRTRSLATKLSSVKRNNSLHCFPKWIGKPTGLFQDPIAPATLPNSIAGSNLAGIKNSGSQYWVALGLALQGIGAGQDTANLHVVKKGLLSKLSRKKAAPNLAWGLDIGDSQLKLVCVQKDENDVKIVRAESLPLGEDSIDTSKTVATVLFKAFQKVASDIIPAEEPVVANISPDLVLSRFIELPSNTPSKKVAEFIAQEARANIPVRFDDLSMGYCVFDPHAEEAMSRQAVCFAPRKNDLESHADLLSKAGINLASVVPEPLAYLNVFETFDYFGELISRSTDAILCIDVGAKRTTFVTCSPFGIWFRTINWGVDVISQAYAKALRITSKEGNKARMKPLDGSLIDNFSILESCCIVPRRELERSMHVAKDQLGEFRVSQILLTGGGAYQPLLGSLLNGDLG